MLFGVPDEIPDVTRSSGGKDLYMGSPVLVTGKVSGAIGNVPGPPGGSRGSTRWGHRPQRAAWAKCGKGPAPRWAGAPPTRGPGRRKGGKGETLGSDGPKAHLVVRLPLSPLGRPLDGSKAGRTPWGGNPRWGRRPSPSPIYSGGFGAARDRSLSLSLGAALPLSLLVSRSAWRSPAGVPRSSITTMPLCCCWTESSPTSPSLLAGSRRGRRHRAARVLNAEAPWFGA